MMISIQLIPNLMLEEKNTRTLDALLVSPASAWELAAGKALAGLFYGLLASTVIVAVFFSSLIHFLPIFLAILLGGMFMALVGLWTGLKVDNRGQLSFYVLGWIGLLFIPVVVYQLSDLFSGGLGEALRWLPGNLVYRLVQASFTRELPWQGVLLDAAGMLIWTLLAGAVLVWQIRRLDLARVETAARSCARPGECLRRPQNCVSDAGSRGEADLESWHGGNSPATTAAPAGHDRCQGPAGGVAQ